MSTQKQESTPDEQLDNAMLNIAIIRGARGLSQLELTRVCNLKSSKRVNDLESGRCRLSIDELIKIADYFGVSIDGLLKRKAKIEFE